MESPIRDEMNEGETVRSGFTASGARPPLLLSSAAGKGNQHRQHAAEILHACEGTKAILTLVHSCKGYYVCGSWHMWACHRTSSCDLQSNGHMDCQLQCAVRSVFTHTSAEDTGHRGPAWSPRPIGRLPVRIHATVTVVGMRGTLIYVSKIKTVFQTSVAHLRSVHIIKRLRIERDKEEEDAVKVWGYVGPHPKTYI